MNGVGFAAIIIVVAAAGGIITWAANHRLFWIREKSDLHEIGKVVASARAESDRLPGTPADAEASGSSATGQRGSVRRIARGSDTSS